MSVYLNLFWNSSVLIRRDNNNSVGIHIDHFVALASPSVGGPNGRSKHRLHEHCMVAAAFAKPKPQLASQANHSTHKPIPQPACAGSEHAVHQLAKRSAGGVGSAS